MPSVAARAFGTATARGLVLRRLATDPRLRPITAHDAQACLHSALAAYVGAWEAYCEAVVAEFYDVAADATRIDFTGLHTIAKNFADASRRRFNTPDFTNSRNLILTSTGFDPLPVWAWPARGRNVPWVTTRLNEILQTRHSFAHGFPLPPYTWTLGPSGRVRLTTEGVDDVEALLRSLVRSTDVGLSAHVAAVYGRQVNW